MQNQGLKTYAGNLLVNEHDTLLFSTNSDKIWIDSVEFAGITYRVENKLYSFHLDTLNGGIHQLSWNFFLSNGKTKKIQQEIVFVADKTPEEIVIDSFSVVPHNQEWYTQGLEIHNEILYESAGRYGESSLNRIDPQSGSILLRLSLDSALFAEGLTFVGDSLYMLTWKEGQLLKFTTDLRLVSKELYQREGWGLCYADSLLVASDGSDKLYFLERDLSIKKKLTVYDHLGAVSYLNELEWVDGTILANVLGQDFILVINPENGQVICKINLASLIKKYGLREKGALNGIAFHKETGKLYLTGKNWPYYFVCDKPDQIKSIE